jgi:putative transposase
VKRSLLVEGGGGPLAAVVAAANVPDFKLLEATLDAVVVPRPHPAASRPQHLCLDKGYDNDTGWGVALERDYEPHIALIRDARPPRPRRHPARRWVVERTLAWLSKCRALLIRWDKKAANYLGLIQLACALLWYRRHHRLSRPHLR